jgi:hypothetical protein
MFEKPLYEITFTDVASFCAEKQPATVQLDYVPSLEVEDVPRRIAAMANTFGGYLIVGVASNARTSRPSSCRGIIDDSHLGEHLARCMRAVRPYPHCAFHKTTSKNGRVFVVIHVLEGRYGPYYVAGEAQTVWLRESGRRALVAATRPDIIHIREKQTLKEWHTDYTEQAFLLLHTEAEAARVAARNPDDGESVYMPELLEDMPLLTMYLRPSQAIPGLLGVTPQTLQQWAPALRPACDATAYVPHFPEPQMETMPDGVVALEWYDNPGARDVHCDQLYTDGTVYHAHSILQYVDSEPAIYLTTIAMELADFLMVAHVLYARAGYHGTLEGSVMVTQAKGLQVVATLPLDRSPIPSSLRTVPFAAHAWPLLTDTHLLADPHTALAFRLSLMEKIHWDMRASGYSEEYVHTALWQTGRTLLPPPPPEDLGFTQVSVI